MAQIYGRPDQLTEEIPASSLPTNLLHLNVRGHGTTLNRLLTAPEMFNSFVTFVFAV